MVRRVRLSADECLGELDPTHGRPAYDDLDDLVLDAVGGGTRPQPNEPPRRTRRRRLRPSAEAGPRRHLADADWLNPPAAPRSPASGGE